MPANVGGRYKGTAPERIAKRKKDIEIVGALAKAVESRTAKKAVESSPAKVKASTKGVEPMKEPKPLGEDPRGIIYGLTRKTQIEENKQERKSKGKK